MRFGETLLLALAGAGVCYPQIITTVAGTDTAFLTTAMPALQAPLKHPGSLALDQQGNLYIADPGNGMVVRVSSAGVLTPVAGNGSSAYSGDGGPAIHASLAQPQAVALDAAGNLYIADNQRVRKVTPNGIIATIAGGGSGGDGGPAISADLGWVTRVAADMAGNVYVSGTTSGRIRKITPAGTINTVMDSLSFPGGMAVDAAGNLYFAETGLNRVRKVSPSGAITTVAGPGLGGLGDGGPATAAKLNQPQDVSLDAAGNLYIADAINHRIRKVTTDGIISTVAGRDSMYGPDGDGGPATGAWIANPQAVVVDAAGNLYIGDVEGNRVRKVNTAGNINVFAGSGQPWFFGDGGAATGAQLSGPAGVVVDAAGNLFIADTGNNRIRKVSANGMISTIAGNGQTGFSGDGGPATAASLEGPQFITLDAAGNLFVADVAHYRVRKVTPVGLITTVAGKGDPPIFSGDGGPATSAGLTAWLKGVAVDNAGNLYIADYARVRKVNAAGIISTVAGTGEFGSSGDGGPALEAQFEVSALAVDPAGNLYIGDNSHYRIRKVTPAGIISTVVGNGSSGFSGDGGPATIAQLKAVNGMAFDTAGNLYFADGISYRVRRVTPAGIITTVAGCDRYDRFTGDGGLATSATLNAPLAVAVDAAGNLYIADSGNNRIRKVSADISSGTAKPKLSSVVNGASYQDQLAPNTWITITGTDLSQTTRSWASADFAGNQLPTQLDGVRVYVNGSAIAVSYISPTQINALTASTYGGTPVSAPVEVITPQGRSDPLVKSLAAYAAPALFTYSAEGGKYVIAHTPGGVFIGKTGLVPGLFTRPALPGETITVYGTGFGPTDPAYAPGVLIAAPLPLSGRAYFGIDVNNSVDADWAGLIGVGLYQMNLTIPDNLPDGDHKIRPMVGGFGSGTTDTWITVQR